LSQYPSLSNFELKNRILEGADPKDKLKAVVASGSRLNIKNSLENDNIPPNKISMLKLKDKNMTSVLMSWMSAGDDGAKGRASDYELRLGKKPITNKQQWDSAEVLLYSKIESQKTTTAFIENLPVNTEGYLAIKSIDNVGNYGGFSKSTAIQTRPAKMIYENLASNLNRVVVSGLWGLESLSGGNSVFSDSPSTSSENNLESSLLLKILTKNDSETVLSFDMKYQLEKKYDYLFIESAIGESGKWKILSKVTGFSDWRHLTYRLPRQAAKSDAITRVRFRLLTDKSVAKDGVMIDNIRLYEPK
jgi:hypothetical protein